MSSLINRMFPLTSCHQCQSSSGSIDIDEKNDSILFLRCVCCIKKKCLHALHAFALESPLLPFPAIQHISLCGVYSSLRVQRGDSDGTAPAGHCPPTQASQYSVWAYWTWWRKKTHSAEWTKPPQLKLQTTLLTSMTTKLNIWSSSVLSDFLIPCTHRQWKEEYLNTDGRNRKFYVDMWRWRNSCITFSDLCP